MRLQIRNFRSIKHQELELAPITVVYGSTGTGKSSLLYALLTLKNVILEPSRFVDGFFNYHFLNLGDYEAVVFDHQTDNSIELCLTTPLNGLSAAYQAVIGKNQGSLNLHFESMGDTSEFRLPVSFPYGVTKQEPHTVVHDGVSFGVNWDGITAQVMVELPDQQEVANDLSTLLNNPIEILRKTGIVSLKRGFTKPLYSSIPVSSLLATEEEVATLLVSERYLVHRVSHYLEQTLERDLRVSFKSGTSQFSIDTTDRRTGLGTELVNDGFGVNQVVYILAKCLYKDTGLICIEEPEVHLHPSAVRALARTLVQIVSNEGKRFVISTHSEAFVTALLALVSRGEVEPSELAFYWVKKDERSTQFERQAVNEKGQLDGGLSSFMAGELEDVAAFLGMDE